MAKTCSLFTEHHRNYSSRRLWTPQSSSAKAMRCVFDGWDGAGHPKDREKDTHAAKKSSRKLPDSPCVVYEVKNRIRWCWKISASGPEDGKKCEDGVHVDFGLPRNSGPNGGP